MEYILFNQHFEDSDQVFVDSNPELVIYEVLRVIDTIPLFYEDHLERLKHSCEIVGRMIDLDSVISFKQLIELCLKNKKLKGNLMISLLFYNDRYDVLVRFIPHLYPVEQDYSKGVEVGFLFAERSNPNAKVAQTSVRIAADKLLAQTGFYEVLLVDHHNCITEGSRSNCFFIKDNKLYSAPQEKILKGITLLKVMDIAREMNIEIVVEPIDRDKLVSFDAMFLTGTSPKVLPVFKAGEFLFDVKHPIMKKIKEEYDRITAEYIEQKKETFRQSPL